MAFEIVKLAIGNFVIMTESEKATCGQAPDAKTVFVTKYLPGVEVLKFTKPVDGLILKPEGLAIKFPATPPPIKVGLGLEALSQKVLPV